MSSFNGIFNDLAKEMALVWHGKASHTALQTSSVLPTLSFGADTHMTTVKEIAVQCREIKLSLNNE